MPSNLPRFTLRINQELMDKFHYIVEQTGSSANRETEALIKMYVEVYERNNGEIKLK